MLSPAITTRLTRSTGCDQTTIVAESRYGRGKVRVPYDSAKTAEQNHLAAALEYCRRYGWSGKLIGGKAKRHAVWVLVDDRTCTVAIE